MFIYTLITRHRRRIRNFNKKLNVIEVLYGKN